MKKYLIIALLILGLGAAGAVSANAQTSSPSPSPSPSSSPKIVSGWAWSSTIGWISLNSANPGSGGGSYKVQVDDSGNLTGYGWSSNIGWVKFAAGRAANMNLTTGVVTGWARACAGASNGKCGPSDRTDGWDGWISLSGPSYPSMKNGSCSFFSDNCTSGTFLDTTYRLINGFGWGDAVVGWLRFNASIAGLPPAPLTVTCSSNPGSIDSRNGGSVTYTAFAEGGSGTYKTYSWHESGITETTMGMSNSYIKNYPGIIKTMRSMIVTVWDSNNANATGTCVPTVILNNIPVEPPTIGGGCTGSSDANGVITYWANPTGGWNSGDYSSYKYNWNNEGWSTVPSHGVTKDTDGILLSDGDPVSMKLVIGDAAEPDKYHTGILTCTPAPVITTHKDRPAIPMWLDNSWDGTPGTTNLAKKSITIRVGKDAPINWKFNNVRQFGSCRAYMDDVALSLISTEIMKDHSNGKAYIPPKLALGTHKFTMACTRIDGTLTNAKTPDGIDDSLQIRVYSVSQGEL